MTIKELSERKLACVEMAKQGSSFQEIADYFGLSKNTVRQTCAKYNIRENPRKPRKKPDRDVIIELLKEGKKTKNIAQQLDVSYPAVQKIAKEEGLTFIWLKKQREEFRAYKSLGYSLSEVAEHFGVNVSKVQTACAGMPKKKASQFASGNSPWNKGKHTGNQFTNGNYDQIGNAKRLIREANPEMEYVSGFISSDKPVIIRHIVCGMEFSRSMASIRRGRKTICPLCDSPEAIKARTKKRNQQRHLFETAPQKEWAKQERREQAIIAKSQLKEQCRIEREARRHDCPVCGTSTTNPIYCSNGCRNKAEWARKEVKRRHTIRAVTVDKDITLEGLFKRDNGVCWICGLPCDYSDIETTDKAMIAGNMYPSIDHVKALVDGGEHSWANVKLAHRICNSDRYHSPHGVAK